MTKTFITKINDTDECMEKVSNLLKTAKYYSEKEKCKIFVMSNGEIGTFIHEDYVEEFKNDGYWVSAIFVSGYQADI